MWSRKGFKKTHQESSKDNEVAAEATLHHDAVLKSGVDRGRAAVAWRVLVVDSMLPALVLGEDNAVFLGGRLVRGAAGGGRTLLVTVLLRNGAVAGVGRVGVTALEDVELAHGYEEIKRKGGWAIRAKV